MALIGWVNTSSYDGRYYRVTCDASQSIPNNSSTVTWKLEALGGNSSWYAERTLEVVIAGKTVYNKSDRVQRYLGVIASGTIPISHDNQGDASFGVSIRAAVYTSAVNCTGSGTFKLNTIPRASAFGTITGNTIGSNMTVNITRHSSAFTHQLWYKMGNSAWYDLRTGIGTSKTFTILMDLCSQIPNSASGTLQLRLRTLNGGTQIGSDVYQNVTVNVPSTVKPIVNSASVSIDNSANSVVADWGLYVAGYSKAKIVANASGSYGSTIKSFVISGGYSTTRDGSSLSYTGDILTSSGNKTFDIVAKDSRGRLSDKKSAGSITVYAYSKPSVTLFSVERSAASAEKMIIRADWDFSSVNGKNSASATLLYKKASSSAWTTYGVIEKNEDVTLDGTFDETSSYNFRIIVTDALSNKSQAETFVSTIAVLLDFRAGGRGLGIGKIAETDSMEVALDARFMGDVYIYDNDGTPIPLDEYIKLVVGV